MDKHKAAPAVAPQPVPTLPSTARLPINRCNLPAALLGGLTFQRHPAPLLIDGVLELHNALFVGLARTPDPGARAQLFQHYLRASFCLGDPEAAGLDPRRGKPGRHKLDYLRLLRGWLFDCDSREGAVLKGWVESRFGLLPRQHRGPLGDFSGANYARYLAQRADGLYNTNALEAQLDLLYSYCQFELAVRHRQAPRLRLFRGANHIDAHELMATPSPRQPILLLNNLSSFSGSPERADEFGDAVFVTWVPLAKILFFPDLIPGLLQGEDEYLVIGGLYQVELLRL